MSIPTFPPFPPVLFTLVTSFPPQAADQIVVMRNGQVAEVGTHDELVARPGSHYNELMSVQNLTMAST